MSTIYNLTVGENRGTPRIWIAGSRLVNEGVTAGARYNRVLQQGKVILVIDPDGEYVVSKRQSAQKAVPLIDITTKELGEYFDHRELIRVVVHQGKIVITAHSIYERMAERENRVRDRLKEGKPLRILSHFHGGGILDRAVHAGLHSAGVKSELSVAIEIESTYLDVSLRHADGLWSDDSIAIESPIQDVNMMKSLNPVEILISGTPCTGASRAGRSKNKLMHAESHDAAGSLFIDVLQSIESDFAPACIVIENVPEYAKCYSMSVTRAVLSQLGYHIQERVFDGTEFGALEKRKRFCMVAISEGLMSEFPFDLDAVHSNQTKPASLNEVLEDVPLDSDRWKSFDYLREKEARDISQGKGFKRQLLSGEEPHCGTIGRHYAKCRSTEPFIRHPVDEHLSRLLTPAEHARVKGVEEGLVDGLSETIAHQVLGQSVQPPVFMAVGEALGGYLLNLASDDFELVA